MMELWSWSECCCAKFTGFDSFIETLFVRVEYFIDFGGDVLLSMVLLCDDFFEVLWTVLLGHVCHSHLQLSSFLFEFEYVNLLFILGFFVGDSGFGFLLFGLWFGRDLIWFGLFFHGILLETFDDGLFGHEGGDFIFKIGLSGITEWVHFLYASLNLNKITIYSWRRVAMI